VLAPVLQLVIAPLLVGLSTQAARRWGAQIGGALSAFPAIVGPLLLIAAVDHGPAFAARSATGTLLGLVALSGFVLAYGRAAARAGWLTSLAVGWSVAAAIAAVLMVVHAGLPVALAAAGGSLLLAHRLLPHHPAAPAVAAPRWDLPVRMAMTAVLMVSLTAAASRLGPVVGGLLAALPALASILAVFTHGGQGSAALVELLRGMLRGMAAFVAFCLLVALLVVRAGTPAAFCVATFAAVAVQAVIARRQRASAARTA
jgi:hypothetical protein